MYLPLKTITPIFVGVINHFVEKGAQGDEKLLENKREQGVLLSSGFIAGEGVLGVLIAAYAFKVGSKPPGIGWAFEGIAGEIAALTVFAAIAAYLISRTRRKNQVNKG